MGLLVAVLASTIAPAQAQVSQTWIATNPNNDWSLSALNWDAGVGWTDGNDAIFGGVGETVELKGDITAGNITFNSNGYTIADADNDGTLTLGLPSTITVTTADHIATISEAIIGGGITKAGAGSLILSGANLYDGETTVSQGRLLLEHNNALGSAVGGTVVSAGAEVSLGDGVTVSGETITVSGTGASFGGALTTAEGASATWAGTVVLGTAARIGAGAGGTLEFSGPIQGSGLEISGQEGSGIVLISGTNNTYTGATNIVRGTLQLGAANALPATTVLNVDSNVAAEDAIFDLNGFDQTVAGLTRTGAGGNGASYVTNFGETAATLSIVTNNAATTHTYNGMILDGLAPVSISKSGAGTLVLSGENTFSGEASVKGSGSNLLITNANALGSTLGNTVAGDGGRVTLANGITISGETIRIHGGGDNFGALQAASNATATWDGKVILNDSNGARLGAASGGTLIVSGPIENGIGNTLQISATGANLGTVVISGSNNTYTGGTNIIRGILRIGAHDALPTTTTLNVDSVAQSSVTENAIFDLNGFNQTLAGLASSGADLGNNGAFIQNNGATASTLTLNQAKDTTSTFTGIIQDGTSQLSLTKAGTGNLLLTKAHTYTGDTVQTGGSLELLGAAGALASTSIAISGNGWLVLDNVAAGNNTNRLADTAQITLNGGNFSLRGSNEEAATETLGSFTLASGLSQIKITHGDAKNATLTANQLVRTSGGGVGYVSGIDLGKDGTSTDGVGRILFTNAPTLVGGADALETGRNTSAQNTKIVPYLIGEVDPATGLGSANGTPNTFLTYHSTGGLRPLDVATEFVTDAYVEGANTRILTDKTFGTGTVNSLLMASGGKTLSLGNGVLTNTSGAILFTGSANIQNGTLNFGSAEAVITATSGSTGVIGSKITGTGGLTFTGPGTLGLGGSTTDYTGGTVVQGGGVIVPQTSSTSVDDQVTRGPFGVGDIIFVDGGIRSSSNASYAIGNNLKLRGDLALPSGGRDLNLTGPVAIEGSSRTLTNSTSSTTTFSGAIGDGGNGYGLTLAGSGAGTVVFAGDNTYTGPTNIQSGRLVVSGSIAGSTFVGNAAAPSTVAVLRGSGTLGSVAAFTAGATIDPGDALDTTAALKTGALSLSNGAHLSLQIGGITAGAALDGYDQIVASGQVSLTGGDLKLSLLGTPSFDSNTTLFLIVNNSSFGINGTFSTFNGAAFDPTNIVLGGQQFALIYNANYAGAGSDNLANDLALIAVPEPTSSAMLLAGLATFGFSRLRRSASGRKE